MAADHATYWHNILDTFQSLARGLRITWRHFVKARKTQPIVSITGDNYFSERSGIATIQYPYEMQPIPDTGRYRLHNEIDDCIVCDKCAKVCPVDCIDIEPVRAIEEIGKTSDGTSKRIYAAKFDIDMSKCCFCGLCTTVCPTECLTMTKVYDFSVTNLRDHNFEFGEMTEAEITEKKTLFEDHQKAKAASKVAPLQPAAVQPGESADVSEAAKPARPVFKPKIKPPGMAQPAVPAPAEISPELPSIEAAVPPPATAGSDAASIPPTEVPRPLKPVFKPKIKAPAPPSTEVSSETPRDEAVKGEATPSDAPASPTDAAPAKPLKPVFKPRIKAPGVPPPADAQQSSEPETPPASDTASEPDIKPPEESKTDPIKSDSSKPLRPVYKPRTKPPDPAST